MKLRLHVVLGLVAMGLFTQSQFVLADDPTENDPQPYRCEDSVVTKVGTYFEKDPRSGFYAVFQSKLGVEKFADANAAVVDRSADAKSAIARQKPGDKVQVCLLYRPHKDPYCDPDKDPRGRVYRIYNYRLKAAYSGWNANHWCGGA